MYFNPIFSESGQLEMYSPVLVPNSKQSEKNHAPVTLAYVEACEFAVLHKNSAKTAPGWFDFRYCGITDSVENA